MNVESWQFLLFLLLNATVFGNGLWLTCWLGGWKSWAERLLDAFLYSVTLLIVGFLALHFIHQVTLQGLLVFHVAAALGLGWAGHRRGWEIRSFFSWDAIRGLGWTGQLLLCFVVAGFGSYIYHCRYLPVLATDPLAYHLPMPVHWLKTHELSLVPTYLSAAYVVYLPVDGELLWAWLLAPFGNDVMVRFGQMPFLAAMMLATYAVWRRWGLPPTLALAGAALLLLFRPFLQEMIIPDVDLIWTAGMVIFVCNWQRLDGTCQSWARCGLSLGLLVGTKIHGLLFFLPALVLLAIKGFELRRTWRVPDAARSATCLVASVLLVGGWSYLRNLGLTGNPFYPSKVSIGAMTVFAGPLDSHAMANAHGGLSVAWRYLLYKGTFGMARMSATIWSVAVLAGLLDAWLHRREQPRSREVFGLWLLWALSVVMLTGNTPFIDERYLFPIFAIGLIFVGCVLLWSEAVARDWLARVVLIAAAGCFGWESIQLRSVVVLVVIGGPLLFVALRSLLLLQARMPQRWSRAVPVGLAAAFVLIGALFWEPYLKTYQAVKFQLYPSVWGKTGTGWAWLDEQTRQHGTVVAYTGSAFVYPLFGQELQNSLIHVPVQSTPRTFLHELTVPQSVRLLSMESFVEYATQLARENPDGNAWLRRMLEAKAAFLVVQRNPGTDPIEGHWAEEHPEWFEKVFDEQVTTIFRVRPDLATAR